LALIGDTGIDGMRIGCRIEGPLPLAAVPTLRFRFTFENNRQEEVMIVPFICEVKLEDPRPVIHLGQSIVWSYSHGTTSFARIPSGGSHNFDCTFELGYDKLGRMKNQVKKDLFLTVKIYGTLFTKHDMTIDAQAFGGEISSIKVPASEWIDWLSAWIKELRIITISGELGGKLDALKEQLKFVSDEELITELYETYTKRPKPEK